MFNLCLKSAVSSRHDHRQPIAFPRPQMAFALHPVFVVEVDSGARQSEKTTIDLCKNRYFDAKKQKKHFVISSFNQQTHQRKSQAQLSSSDEFYQITQNVITDRTKIPSLTKKKQKALHFFLPCTVNNCNIF